MDKQRWVLPQSVDAPALARQIITQACERGFVPESRTTDCALMTTELVTNALVHGEGEITLSLGRDAFGSVRIEVCDRGGPGAQVPMAPMLPDVTSERGRGLSIVDALAERWGVETGASATCAWFEVR